MCSASTPANLQHSKPSTIPMLCTHSLPSNQALNLMLLWHRSVTVHNPEMFFRIASIVDFRMGIRAQLFCIKVFNPSPSTSSANEDCYKYNYKTKWTN